jgi:Tfp pilus assembly protein PilN
MRAVNLLPPDRKRERTTPKLSPLHGAGLGILVGALALGYWGHSVHGQVDQQKAIVADLDAQAQTLDRQITLVKAGVKTGSSYEADRTLVVGLATARINWSTVVINLSRVAPAGVWLESLSVTTPTSAQGAASGPGQQRPVSITLQAHAPSRTEAALYMARLNAIPGFVNPRLAGGINSGGTASTGPTTTTVEKTSYTFTVEIPIDDAIFGSARPVRPAAAPATTTPTTP